LDLEELEKLNEGGRIGGKETDRTEQTVEGGDETKLRSKAVV